MTRGKHRKKIDAEYLATHAPRGIPCPDCGCAHFFTTHTEPLAEGRIRRRKVCRHCGRKTVTYESKPA